MNTHGRSLELHPGWVVGRVLLFFAVTMFFIAAASGFAPRGWSHDLIAVTAAAVATYLLTMLFTRWDGVRMRDVGASWNAGTLPRFAVGVLLGSGMVAMQVGALLASGYVRWERVALTGWHAAAISAAIFLVVAIREEMAFRGYPLFRLDALWGTWAAMLVVALVFAAEHYSAGYALRDAFLGVFIGSLLFGATALLTRGLAVPMGIHFAWNFGTWMIGTKDTPGFWQPTIKAAMADRSWWIAMTSYWMGGALVVIALWWWRRANQSRSLP